MKKKNSLKIGKIYSGDELTKHGYDCYFIVPKGQPAFGLHHISIDETDLKSKEVSWRSFLSRNIKTGKTYLIADVGNNNYRIERPVKLTFKELK